MAYETYAAKQNSIVQAAGLLHEIRQVYSRGKAVQALLNLYQGGTDPAFNAAVNALFAGAERTEIAQMLNQIDALVTNWETNHAQAIGIA